MSNILLVKIIKNIEWFNVGLSLMTLLILSSLLEFSFGAHRWGSDGWRVPVLSVLSHCKMVGPAQFAVNLSIPCWWWQQWAPSFIKWNRIQSPRIDFSSASFPIQCVSYVVPIQDKLKILRWGFPPSSTRLQRSLLLSLLLLNVNELSLQRTPSYFLSS